MLDKMNYYRNQQKELMMLKERVINSLTNAPAGRLYCEMAQGKYPQYYIAGEKEKGRGQYVRKNDLGLATLLAQKEYDQRILDVIEKKETILNHVMELEEMERLSGIYRDMHPGKRALISPYVLIDEDYTTHWKNNRKGGANIIPFKNTYDTEQGEIVRSKSEKMIADKLFLKGIPYVYEAELKLEQGGTIYPDFTLLNIRTRQTYYLEHFGMMDDPEYCKKALEKMELYEKNGIYLGEQLLTSFESSTKGINMQQIDLIIERYLL